MLVDLASAQVSESQLRDHEGVVAAAAADERQTQIDSVEPSETDEQEIRFDSPRQTLRTFVQAMEDYRRGVEEESPFLRARIIDAVLCLDLNLIPIVNREEEGELVAMMLKEILDRRLVIDFDAIPDGSDTARRLYQIPNTYLRIGRIPEGDREGDFVFTPETVAKARDFYRDVRHLPYLEGTDGGALLAQQSFEAHFPGWAFVQVLGLELWQWVGLTVVLALGVTIRTLVRALLRLVHWGAGKTAVDWDQRLVSCITSPLSLMAACGFWFLSIRALSFHGVPLTVLTVSLRLLFFFALVWLAYRLAEFMIGGMEEIRRRGKGITTLDQQLFMLVSRTTKILVVLVGGLVALQNLGVEVLSLLAGLGVGGLAVALAARDTLANFFGSVMILVDRPFQVGHWIKIGSEEGTVEDIGFRSTRIRTFYNSVISVPNSELAVKPIDNMGMRKVRRIRTTIRFRYDSTKEQLSEFVEKVRTMVTDHPETAKINNHIVVNDFDESGVAVMLYIFVQAPDWAKELLARENILLRILEIAKECGLKVALPARDLHWDEGLALQGEVK